MVVLYVQRSWIDQIGDMAKLLHFRSESDTCVSLLGVNITTGYPLVQVELVGKLDESNRSTFIPTYIPASLILAMFDLTQSEARFHFAKHLRPPQ
jgi:hypothetical protein